MNKLSIVEQLDKLIAKSDSLNQLDHCLAHPMHRSKPNVLLQIRYQTNPAANRGFLQRIKKSCASWDQGESDYRFFQEDSRLDQN